MDILRETRYTERNPQREPGLEPANQTAFIQQSPKKGDLQWKTLILRTPTQVVSGKNASAGWRTCQGSALQKVLVHFGGNSAKKIRAAGPRLRFAGQSGHSVCNTGRRCSKSPSFQGCAKALNSAQKEGVDFCWRSAAAALLTPVKAIGYGLANVCDVWDLYEEGKATADRLLPGGRCADHCGGRQRDEQFLGLSPTKKGWLKMSCNTDYGPLQIRRDEPRA